MGRGGVGEARPAGAGDEPGPPRRLFRRPDVEPGVVACIGINPAAAAFVNRELGIDGRAVVLHHVGDAKRAAAFLVSDAKENDVPVERDFQMMQLQQDVKRPRDHALVVRGAAAKNLAVFDPKSGGWEGVFWGK